MASPSPLTTFDAKPDDYRLPTTVRPAHYDLTFKTDLESLKFWGFALIDLNVVKETDKITFNAAELDFHLDSVSILDSAGARHLHVDKTADEKQERITLHFAENFKAGTKITLSVGWEGKLGANMVGYYTSSWLKDGKKTYYALTQFEPTAARRAFPSWDEPLLKSTYTITLISRSDTVSLSNMPAVSEKPHGADLPSGAAELTKFYPYEDATKAKEEWKVTVFEKSPLVSSYLVAFANGHFEYLESSYKSPLSGKVRPLRIYATADVIHQAQFALDVKAQTLPLYEQVFDVEYPLPKLDTLVAADFDAGAMENWGLITGRTTALLFDHEKSDLAAKKRVAVVQAHEVAHMWFGNITTMAWWDALFLNEGFASLMGEVIILNKIFPEWRPHSSFIIDHLGRALNLDAQRSSHPIQVDCPDANQINQFDALSYSKAASMLRMLSEYVGEEKFLKGVSIYLKKHLYGNAIPEDLWAGIAEATGVDVQKMMDNWTWKIGFPVLTVKENGNKLTIRQDRFISTGDATEDENQTIWYAPLSVLSTDANGKTTIDRQPVLDSREKTIEVDTSKPWKLNAGTSGVYRVAYEPERLKQLGEWAAQENSAFSLDDRMGLVSDAITLAKAGNGKTSSALDLFEQLRSEKEFLVLNSMANGLHSLSNVWWEQPQAVQEQLDAVNRFIYSPIVERLGYEYSVNDSADTRELRTLAIGRAAKANDPSVLKELQSRFAHFQETGDDSRIPPDLIRTIFTNAVKHGGRQEYETVKNVWRKPSTPSARIHALVSLAASKDLELAKETQKFLLDEVPLQDWMYVFMGLGANPVTRRANAEFFKANYAEIIKRFEGNFSLGYFVKFSFEDLSTEKDLAETEEYFKDKDVSKYNLSLHQALDSIRANIAWLKHSQEDVAGWLSEFEKRNKVASSKF